MKRDSRVTLQINLSPGDIAYARQTVPEIVQSHQRGIEERLAIVDCCRPQRTKFIDPNAKFPEHLFYQRVEEITEIAEAFKRGGYFDRIEYVRPGSELLRRLSSRYLGGIINETHDAGACGLMSYLAAFELADTPFLVHYDADMLLYQAPGFDWVSAALSEMSGMQKVLSSTPRISPMFAGSGMEDAPSRHEGRPFVRAASGWTNDWFSTRCFLMDLGKLSSYLPLISGLNALHMRAAKIAAAFPLPTKPASGLRALLHRPLSVQSASQIPSYLAWRYLSPSYPPGPEIMLFRRVGPAGGKCLTLSSEQAWLLHPASKPQRFLHLLPRIQKSIASNRVPAQQRGYADIDLDAWEKLLNHGDAT